MKYLVLYSLKGHAPQVYFYDTKPGAEQLFEQYKSNSGILSMTLLAYENGLYGEVLATYHKREA